eukprot:GHVR01012690.1.p1 GENE.GHVR01012690.1~~GHVR01012690.1.p1  ORF type:complete len:164 (+),score=40.07 GHVR01012690.1:97-588(+)
MMSRLREREKEAAVNVMLHDGEDTINANRKLTEAQYDLILYDRISRETSKRVSSGVCLSVSLYSVCQRLSRSDCSRSASIRGHTGCAPKSANDIHKAVMSLAGRFSDWIKIDDDGDSAVICTDKKTQSRIVGELRTRVTTAEAALLAAKNDRHTAVKLCATPS